MTNRESNVEINLTGEGPAIRQKGEKGVVNEDGSVTEYATDPDPQGEERIVISEEKISDEQKRVLEVLKEHPDWTTEQVSEEAGVSESLVTMVKSGSVGRPLGTFSQIKKAYRNLGDAHKRAVWLLSQYPENDVREIAEAADLSPSTISKYENYNRGLITKLQAWDVIEVSSPPGLVADEIDERLPDKGREEESEDGADIPERGVYLKQKALEEWGVYDWAQERGLDIENDEEIVSSMMQAAQTTDDSKSIRTPNSTEWRAIKLFIEALAESPKTNSFMAQQILDRMERLESEDG